jgi:hypothetical protein
MSLQMADVATVMDSPPEKDEICPCKQNCETEGKRIKLQRKSAERRVLGVVPRIVSSAQTAAGKRGLRSEPAAAFAPKVRSADSFA